MITPRASVSSSKLRVGVSLFETVPRQDVSLFETKPRQDVSLFETVPRQDGMTIRGLLWAFWEELECLFPYSDCFYTPRMLNQFLLEREAT